MRSLQNRYSAFHVAYWANVFSLIGCAAILLKFKGLSTSEVGLVTGASSLATIFLSPAFSTLASKIKAMSIQQILMTMFVIIGTGFGLLLWIPLPKWMIMLIYLLLYAMNISMVPLISTIAMQYIEHGKSVNFGLSRGLGSISYAISAVVIGNLLTIFDPRILIAAYAITGVLALAFLASMPACYMEGKEKKESGSKTSIFKYKKLLWILFAFMLMFAASSALATYLIDIVEYHGGNASLFGMATFVMAASELPIMSIAPRLKRRFGSQKLILTAAAFYGVRNGLIALAPNLGFVLLGMVFQGCSYGLFTPIITYYVAEHLEKEDQIMGQTLIGVMTSGLGAAIGNFSCGFIQENYGMSMMLGLALIFTFSGILFAFLVNRSSKSKQKQLVLEVNCE